MPQSKYDRNQVIASGLTGPDTVVIDASSFKDASIEVTYGAGGAGDLTLGVSNLEVGPFALVTGSEQTVDGAGGTHVWELGNLRSLFLEVSLPAGVTTTSIRLVQIRLENE